MNIGRISALSVIVLACAAFLGTGCSDDDSSNNGTSNNGTSNNGKSNNGTTGSNNGTVTNNGTVSGTCQTDGCEGGQLCNEVTGVCEDCGFDEECGLNGVCNDSARCECATGFHDCSGACVDSTSVDTCGDLCEVCPTATGGTATCDAGVCGNDCDTDMVLNAAGDACVECTENAHCTDPAASTCTDNACVGCTESAGCTHLTDTALCETGNSICVGCLDDSTCGGKSCNLATGLCTGTDLGSVGNCEPCVADTECGSDFRCVAMEFAGTTRDTAYCLQFASGTTCPNDRYAQVSAKTSVDGVSGDFCGIREDLTTCEAINGYGVSCSDDADCGTAGLEDGICGYLEFGDLPSNCTYPCDSSAQCDIYGCAIDLGYCGGF